MGSWYPLYTEEDYNRMEEDALPELLKSDISESLLGLIIKNMIPEWDGSIVDDFVTTGSFDISKIDLLDFPSIDSLNSSIEKLYVLGFIDCAYRPSIMGLIKANVTKIDLESTRMILAGYQYGACILDLITIASFMYVTKRSYKDTRSKNKYNYSSIFDKNEESIKYYNKLFIADDFIETIFIWEDFMEQIGLVEKTKNINNIKKWTEENGLDYKGLMKVIEIRDEVINNFIQVLGLNPFYNGIGLDYKKYNLKTMLKKDFIIGLKEIKKIKRCIYEGFRLNIANWDDKKMGYILDSSNKKIKIQSDVITSLPFHESFEQTRPKTVAVRNINLSKGFSEVYEFNSDCVSVFDGYIDIDYTFNTS